jgi:hypothetical protein
LQRNEKRNAAVSGWCLREARKGSSRNRPDRIKKHPRHGPGASVILKFAYAAAFTEVM